MKKLLLLILLVTPLLAFCQDCKYDKTSNTTEKAITCQFGHPIFLEVTSYITFSKIDTNYFFKFQYIKQDYVFMSVGTTNDVIVTLKNNDVFKLIPVEMVHQVQDKNPIYHNDRTTITITTKISKDQLKKIGEVGLITVGFHTITDKYVEDGNRNKNINALIMKAANCILQ